MTTTAALTVPPLQPLERLYDALAAGLHRLGLGQFGLDPARLLRQAERRYPDHPFLPELAALLTALAPQQQLNLRSQRALAKMIGDALHRYHAVQQARAALPTGPAASVTAPLFVVGLPRSGTTLLQNLLSLHPGCRWLRSWESDLPFPPLSVAWGGPQDARRRRFEQQVAGLRARYPELDALHELGSPAECWELLWPSFVSHTLFLLFGSDHYPAWREQLTAESLRRAYRFYREQLHYLQQRQPGCHWVLKAPEHSFNLAVLLEVFPDARIIQLHRDPQRVAASLCGLGWTAQATISGTTPTRSGPRLLALLDGCYQTLLASRRQLPSAPFYDLYYTDLVRDPQAAVAAIYAHFQQPLPPDMVTAMQDWLGRRHGERSPPRYRLADFDLTPAAVEQIGGAYRDYFQIPVEHPH